MRPIFVSNCEGTISKNKNALELTAHFVPEGDRIYDIITKYDYVRANFPKRKDYKIGNTSKLVLPFLLAFDATNKNVEEFSLSNLVLRRNSKETLNYVKTISDAFILGTSYEHHARAICRETGFPLENTFCTKVNLDQFELTQKEKSKLKALAWEIGGLPPIDIPSNAVSLRDLSKKDQAIVKRLDKIFWKEITKTQCKQIYSYVNIADVTEKLTIIQNLIYSHASSLENVMYVGSDTTDVEAMNYVKSSGGLAVSFNGNEATVRNADVAVLSDDYAPISVLADLFLRFGKAEAARVAGNFDKDVLWLSTADPALLDRLFELHPATWPKVHVVSQWNMDLIVS
jgi:energy-converting hydrogenase A subunit R